MVAESAGAFAVLEVQNHVVVVVGAGSHRYVIEVQLMAHLPGNDVIGAGGISTESKSADNFALSIVKWEAAAKDDHPTDSFANHRICGRSKGGGIAKSGFGVGRGTGGQAVKASAGLGRGIYIGRGKRVIITAERIGRVGLRCGNDAAARPFIAAGVAAEDDVASDAVTVDHHRPFLIAHAAVFRGTLFHHRLEDATELIRFRKTGAVGRLLRKGKGASGNDQGRDAEPGCGFQRMKTRMRHYDLSLLRYFSWRI